MIATRPESDARWSAAGAFTLATSLVLAASLTGCRAFEQDLRRQRTQELVLQAEQTALAGHPAQALRDFDLALSESPGGYEPFRTAYTGGWLRQVGASAASGEEALRLLEEAQGQYRAALAVRPADPDAGKNLALVLASLGRFDEALSELDLVLAAGPPQEDAYTCLLLRGDLLDDEAHDPLEETRSAEQARAAYDQAWQLLPEDPRAPQRIVALELRLLDESPSADEFVTRATRLFALCRDLCRDELRIRRFGQIASDGYEGLMERCPVQSAPILVAWVELQARRTALSMQALARLPALGACEDIDQGLRELRLLLAHPDTTRLDGLLFWNPLPRSPEAEALDEYDLQATFDGSDTIRQHVFVRAKRSLARARVFNAAYEEAEAILWSARDDAELLQGDREGDYRIRIDVALDLAVLLHTNRGILDPERGKLKGLISEDPLQDYSVEILKEEPDDVRREGLQSSQERLKVHTILGLIYAEMGDQYNRARRAGTLEEGLGELDQELGERAWGGLALLHLQRAQALAVEPLPRLAQTVGGGLSLADAPLEAYLDSIRGYLALDSRELALDVYGEAVERADTTARRMRAIDDLLFPRVGLYAGASLGATRSTRSAGDLQKDLSDRGQDADVSIDGTQRGFKAYVGWRFQEPWAVELGFARFEGLSSRIRETNAPPDTSALLNAVGDKHPIAGEGLTLAVQYIPLDGRRWQAFTRGGLWLWKSDNEFQVISSATGSPVLTKQVDENGLDPFVGLGLQYRAADRWSLRAEFERYWLERGEIDFLSAGLVFKF